METQALVKITGLVEAAYKEIQAGDCCAALLFLDEAKSLAVRNLSEDALNTAVMSILRIRATI